MRFGALTYYMRYRAINDFVVEDEPESSGYESGIVKFSDGAWRVRTARVTPTKPGAFVAVWKRGASGETEPFSEADSAQGLMVFVEHHSQRGVFTFPKRALVELGIITASTSTGKRGFRLYPSWCTDLNRQALRTQGAQAPYFERYE